MNYLKEDTIVALSTAVGKSAIAVIRLSGMNSFKIINKIFRTHSKSQKQVKYGHIVDGTEKKDEVLCTFLRAPHTYTGENLVEISVHGNPIIVNEVITLLHKNGARLAEPGEFTYRAFLNNKMDLTKAEAVCSLIASKTERSAKAALNNLSGEFSLKIKNINTVLTNITLLMETTLEYPEEDIVFLSHDKKVIKLDSCIKNIQNLLDSYKTSKILQHGIKSAIIGRPNVGKSLLLNKILGKNRAIVTNIAGTTSDSIEETINYKGVALTIIDTAGIRTHVRNLIESLGQKKTKETIRKSDVLIWLFDASSELDKDDKKIAKFIGRSDFNRPVIGVLNKSDLFLKLSPNSIAHDFSFSTIISISAKTGIGILTLLDELTKIAGLSDSMGDCLTINFRHFILLKKAQESLLRTKQLVDLEEDNDEIICFEVKRAQMALNEILGIDIKQDILDAIFSTFCIGK
ncbi:MAG: tRNA uridine-5-carboxymethylaminomethyl(34) synthesis GTPase MnmE [Endomicrobium sp.]|jgi:tRNA modification GTPase|nr:tRNA uridine-5-carboxymethylaminomethyl(34) synthesis GTPase MnmE [Endomicrobium sp.]